MKIGLVLSGGGGKGAYELGVWKALKELNLNKYISVFSGTSIGAFNAALFAMDDLEKAEKLSVQTGKKAMELIRAKGKASDNRKWSDVVKKEELQAAEKTEVPK